MQLNNSVEGKLLTKVHSVTKAEGGDLIIKGYANTVSKDRAGDVIPRSTWEDTESMSNYLKNPIILAYHDHSKPIGKMIDYTVTDKGLEIEALISQGAGDVYKLIEDGVLSTFSIGFSIKDAKYIPEDDTFYINKVELYEVSVVSIPCNQDSVFSISKSLSESKLEDLKSQFITPPSEGEQKPKEENQMKLEDIQALLEETAAKAASSALANAKSEEDLAKAEKAKVEAEKAQKKKDAQEAAAELVSELEEKLAKNNGAFADTVKAQQETIENLQDEIAQIVASRNKNFAFNKITDGMGDQEGRKLVNEAVLLGLVTQKDMFETSIGIQSKAVNQSSSIEVSSDAYETIFSTDLIRDIQAELIIAPLFSEVPMTAASLTIPVNPDRKNATWVAGSDFGTNNSSGGEITTALTEITLKTLKLAAKSYITDETSEDAIIPLLPLIRTHLVEAHANEVDRAFLVGSGTGQPLGLVGRATAAEGSADATGKAGGVEVTTATANGATPVTAKMILKARKKLKLYGLNVRDVSLIVSTEAYYLLIEDDAWADVNLVGSNATKLNGQVGSIYGMPVMVSDHFAAPAASAAYAVLVNTKNFVVPVQRGVTVKTDFDVEKDRRVIVATQRLNLESLIRDTDSKDKGVVAVTYAAA